MSYESLEWEEYDARLLDDGPILPPRSGSEFWQVPVETPGASESPFVLGNADGAAGSDATALEPRTRMPSQASPETETEGSGLRPCGCATTKAVHTATETNRESEGLQPKPIEQNWTPETAGDEAEEGKAGPADLLEFDPYAAIRSAMSPEHANVPADEVTMVLGRVPAALVLQRLLNSPEVQQAALASLLGKGGRRSVRVNGSDISIPAYLRAVSRLCREVAEQTEQELDGRAAGSSLPQDSGTASLEHDAELGGETFAFPEGMEVAQREGANAVTSVIHGWGQYQDSVARLPKLEQDKIDQLAEQIVSSFAQSTVPPFRTVMIVGHADKDSHGKKFEDQVSFNRAKDVKNALSKRVLALWAQRKMGPPPQGDVVWEIHGAGSERMIAPAYDPRNRRVEVTLIAAGAPAPGATPLPDVPPSIEPAEGERGVTHTADLSDGFFGKMHAVAAALQTQAPFLLAVMNFESGIRASAHNPNGHASGLIQFMPAILQRLGWTQGHEAFRRLTAEEQMPFVERYYRPYVRQGLNSIARLYQATFLPATLSRGSEPDTVLVDVNNNDNASAYAPNRGLDRRGDRRILVGDLTAFVERAKGTPRWREALERLQATPPASVPPLPAHPPVPAPPAPTTHPMLRSGARGEAVREAQTKLNAVHSRNLAASQPGLQGAPLVVDGIFGSKTRNAVVSFQQQAFPAEPRKWDGIIGPKTWAKLDAASAGVPAVMDRRLSRKEVMRWFAGGIDSQGQPMGRVTENNRVTYLIRGRSAFDAMVRAMKTANAPGHFIYLLGWWLSDDFPVSGGMTMQQIFTSASQAGVAVRAMLWDKEGKQNTAQVDRINALPNGAAILDNRTLNFGSHHQKVLIVNGVNGLAAFCGGVDINPDRILTVTTGTFSSGGAGTPMHDVHCQIEGPAAFDLLQTFRQRWSDHPDHVHLDQRKGTPPSVLSPAPIPNGREWVQIGRTFGNGNAHHGIDSEKFGTRPRGYTFLRGRAGEQTVKRMILHAISQARRFIYLEDQYLVNLEVRDSLILALPNIEHLTILLPDGSISDLPQGNFRRREFIAPLRMAGGNKVRVFHPYPPRDPFGYVHAKMWIFDDEYTIIGSANCNRRGYTHDSEVVAGICDEGSGGDLRFAHKLRMELWALHLNMNVGDLTDGVASAAFWLRPVGTGRVAPHDENAGIETLHTDESWNNLIDPDGS